MDIGDLAKQMQEQGRRTDKRFDVLDTKIDDLRQHLFGNGRMGLATRVTLIEESERRREEHDRSRTRRAWGLCLVIAGLVGSAVWSFFQKGG